MLTMQIKEEWELFCVFLEKRKRAKRRGYKRAVEIYRKQCKEKGFIPLGGYATEDEIEQLRYRNPYTHGLPSFGFGGF